MKGVVECLNRAAQNILIWHGRKNRRGPPLSHARAQGLLGAFSRSALVEFG